MIFLQIIGGIVVAIIVLLILFFLYLKFKYGKFLDADTDHQPLIIHLNKDIDPNWTETKKARQTINQLTSIGFETGGAYMIKEMPGTQLISMHKGPICAVVYQNPMAGIWVDMVLNEIKGTEYTISNAPYGAEMDSPDNSHKIMESSLSLEEIYTQLEDIKSNSHKTFEQINVDNFREFFESAYKKEMAWQVRKGGVSLSEYIKTSKASNIKLSDKDIKASFLQMKKEDLYMWEAAALEHYQKQQNIEEEQFSEYRYRLIIVPSIIPVESFIDYLCENEFIEELQAEKYKIKYINETDMFKLFDSINSHQSAELRADFIIQQEYPLDLKIYKIPSGL